MGQAKKMLIVSVGVELQGEDESKLAVRYVEGVWEDGGIG